MHLQEDMVMEALILEIPVLKKCIISRDRGVLPRAGYLDLEHVGAK